MAFGHFPSFDAENDNYSMQKENVMDFNDSGDTIQKRDQEIVHITELTNNDQFWDLLNKLICPEDQRITVKEALKHPFFASYSGPSRLVASLL